MTQTTCIISQPPERMSGRASRIFFQITKKDFSGISQQQIVVASEPAKGIFIHFEKADS